MSGMEVTRRTLLSRNRVCGPVAPAPIRPGYTQRARDTALGQGLLRAYTPGHAFDGDPAARIDTTSSPPADAAPTRLHASCCYHFEGRAQAVTLLAVIATGTGGLPKMAAVPSWSRGWYGAPMA